MRTAGMVLMSLASLIVVACGSEDNQDMKNWVKESTVNIKGKIPPLPQIKQNTSVSYEAGNLVDPFQPRKIEPDKKAGRGGGVQPDLNRRKEPLESYPLESIKMVGSILKGKVLYGLVKADRTYLVRSGNYMGQNFGVITHISENEITLKELVEDSAGDWTNRTSTLQMQEQETKK